MEVWLCFLINDVKEQDENQRLSQTLLPHVRLPDARQTLQVVSFSWPHQEIKESLVLLHVKIFLERHIFVFCLQSVTRMAVLYSANL